MIFNKFRSFICITLALLSVLSFYSCKKTDVDVYMFSDIIECKNIEIQKSEDVDVNIYSTPEQDKHLNDLEFQDFFACKYVSNEFEFEIFAYNFVDSEAADTYFENVTGKNNDFNTNFSDVSGLNSYRRIVISEDKAYLIYSNKSDAEQVKIFLSKVFSIELF